MSLTHRLFGIRSCNEVITGKRGRPCLEYDIKRCIAPCVDTICSPNAYRRRGRAGTRLFLEGRNDELVEQLRRADARRGGRASGSKEAAQLRDAIRTVQTLQRSPAEDGDRRARRSRRVRRQARRRRRRRPGLPGAQRPRRRAHRARRRASAPRCGCAAASEARPTALASGDPAVLRAARAPPEIHVPVEPDDDREALETWLSARVGRRVRIVVPQRGEKRGLVDLGDAQRGARLSDALQRRTRRRITTRSRRSRRAGAAGAAAAHRVLRHLDDAGQRDGRVDGGVRGRADAPQRVSQVPGARIRTRRSTASMPIRRLR